jgi:hypothetical protein
MNQELATADTLSARMTYAKALATSELLPKAYHNKPQNVLVALEYGSALGLPAMVAIQQIAVISGKPTMSAQLMGALVRTAGHKLRVSAITDDKGQPGAEASLVRVDDPAFVFRSVWTMDRAKTAGLLGKGGSWATYPAAMLKARAITEVCRDGAPEVLAGVAYTAEELGGAWPSGEAEHAGDVDAGDVRVVDTSHLNVPDADVTTGEILEERHDG